eukprot:4190942-Heterocapsa_arctica.AAC.1
MNVYDEENVNLEMALPAPPDEALLLEGEDGLPRPPWPVVPEAAERADALDAVVPRAELLQE